MDARSVIEALGSGLLFAGALIASRRVWLAPLERGKDFPVLGRWAATPEEIEEEARECLGAFSRAWPLLPESMKHRLRQCARLHLESTRQRSYTLWETYRTLEKR
jgi:hypothetical protein